MRSPRSRRWIGAAATVLGVVLGLAGAACSGVYVWSAVEALGKADRSAVFWYSGFLVFGITLSGSGVALLLLLTAEAWPGRPVFPRDKVRVCLWAVGLAGGLAAAGGVALAVVHIFLV